MRCCVITLFPEMFPASLGYSLAGSALDKGLWSLTTINIRDYGRGKHRNVDDTPYGGGAGMVMRPDVIADAIDAAFATLPNASLIHLTPRGLLLTQRRVETFIDACPSQEYIFLCGRFEAIDERVIDTYQPLEISIGDYILLGGEVAALVMMEVMLRHVQGVLGNEDTHQEESFALGAENACLLEYPHYTKPPVWNGKNIPDILTSGNHARITSWRREQAEHITQARRPDLWKEYIKK